MRGTRSSCHEHLRVVPGTGIAVVEAIGCVLRSLAVTTTLAHAIRRSPGYESARTTMPGTVAVAPNPPNCAFAACGSAMVQATAIDAASRIPFMASFLFDVLVY